jgi:hypothetical protein
MGNFFQKKKQDNEPHPCWVVDFVSITADNQCTNIIATAKENKIYIEFAGNLILFNEIELFPLLKIREVLINNNLNYPFDFTCAIVITQKLIKDGHTIQNNKVYGIKEKQKAIEIASCELNFLLEETGYILK